MPLFPRAHGVGGNRRLVHAAPRFRPGSPADGFKPLLGRLRIHAGIRADTICVNGLRR